MNFCIHSDREVAVKVIMTFLDGNVHEFRILLAGYQAATYAVVGRLPEEIVYMELEYNGLRFAHPIEPDGCGHLKPINIYGGRDHWSQLLREAAMESARGGTTPEDLIDDSNNYD